MHMVVLLNAMGALRAGGRELKLLGVTCTCARGIKRLKAEMVKIGDPEVLGVARIRQHQLAQNRSDALSMLKGFVR